LLLIILLIVGAFCLSSCGKTFEVKFVDSITNETLKNITVDGKPYQNGVANLPQGPHKISSDYYLPKEIDVNKNTEIDLKPKAYLVIAPNCEIDKVFLNGNEVNAKHIVEGGISLYAVSPIKEGNYELKLTSELFKPYIKSVEITSGKNLVEANLDVDPEKFAIFIDSLQNILEVDPVNIKIKVLGTANGNSVSKELTIKKELTTITIQDSNITYSFKDGILLDKEVSQEEKEILLYAKQTVEYFLNVKTFLPNMKLEKVDNGRYFLVNNGTFEGNELVERVVLSIKESKITNFNISIIQEKSNTNLVISVEVI
ncbi:MAG: hypothetical protein K6343_00650, partial [Caldisericaceae bacterium]